MVIVFSKWMLRIEESKDLVLVSDLSVLSGIPADEIISHIAPEDMRVTTGVGTHIEPGVNIYKASEFLRSSNNEGLANIMLQRSGAANGYKPDTATHNATYILSILDGFGIKMSAIALNRLLCKLGAIKQAEYNSLGKKRKTYIPSDDYIKLGYATIYKPNIEGAVPCCRYTRLGVGHTVMMVVNEMRPR